MKIVGQDSGSVPGPNQAGQAAGARAAQVPPAKNDRKAPGVGVTVSSQARALEQGGNTAEVDAEKVQAIRQSIEQNSYVVDPEAIADKLLANAREMLDRSRG